MDKRENIYSFKGFSKVMAFTARQTFKNKAYRLSLIIFVACMSLTGPLQYIMARNGENTAEAMLGVNYDKFAAENVAVVNTTDIDLKMSDITGEEGVSKLGNVNLSLKTEEESAKNLSSLDALVKIDSTEAGFVVNGVVSDETEIPASEISSIVSLVRNSFENARMRTLNITDRDIAVISSGVSTDTMSYEDFSAEENKTVSSDNYMMLAVGFSILVMIVISMSTNFIIASVTEEKQSKLVESLLVSVRPMALLMGKIAGMLSYVLSIVALGFVGSKVSDLALKLIFKDSFENRPVGGVNFDMFGMFGTKGFLVMVLALAIGYLSFAIIGGILGSACSKPEDTQSATGTVMMLVMVGYMGAIFSGIPDSANINLIMSMLPPFSYFTAPIMYVTGRIELWTFLVSVLIQLGLLAALSLLCAKTYRNLILSDSSTPKLKAIFKFAK
ncbi:MAG: ABC transporter permease [Lachnospiraceae bacterium]|nr:ABC transporter permease [Lachnospiraceae bacterium]